jgi:heme/copper-type cytochrome/quinol oxidase subunit 2
MLLVATIVVIAGRVLDARWHASHDEFEAASQQLGAHWLAWLGVIGMLAVAAVAVRRSPSERRNRGYAVVLAGGSLYVPVAAWHFIEHANKNDPELAHVLLATGQVLLFVGALIALVSEVRASRRPGDNSDHAEARPVARSSRSLGSG